MRGLVRFNMTLLYMTSENTMTVPDSESSLVISIEGFVRISTGLIIVGILHLLHRFPTSTQRTQCVSVLRM